MKGYFHRDVFLFNGLQEQVEKTKHAYMTELEACCLRAAALGMDLAVTQGHKCRPDGAPFYVATFRLVSRDLHRPPGHRRGRAGACRLHRVPAEGTGMTVRQAIEATRQMQAAGFTADQVSRQLLYFLRHTPPDIVALYRAEVQRMEHEARLRTRIARWFERWLPFLPR